MVRAHEDLLWNNVGSSIVYPGEVLCLAFGNNSAISILFQFCTNQAVSKESHLGRVSPCSRSPQFSINLDACDGAWN